MSNICQWYMSRWLRRRRGMLSETAFFLNLAETIRDMIIAVTYGYYLASHYETPPRILREIALLIEKSCNTLRRCGNARKRWKNLKFWNFWYVVWILDGHIFRSSLAILSLQWSSGIGCRSERLWYWLPGPRKCKTKGFSHLFDTHLVFRQWTRYNHGSRERRLQP